MARLLRNSDLQTMVKASRVPVINGCDEKYHPSQAIADLITIKEKKGKLKGVKLVYVGIHNNVCNSLNRRMHKNWCENNDRNPNI